MDIRDLPSNHNLNKKRQAPSNKCQIKNNFEVQGAFKNLKCAAVAGPMEEAKVTPSPRFTLRVEGKHPSRPYLQAFTERRTYIAKAVNDAVDTVLKEGQITLGEDSIFLMAAKDPQFFSRFNPNIL